MDVEIPVLTGFLNVPTQSGFSLNRISKKKSCLRYCLLFKSSRHGIERLEICESKEDKNPKIITLENCVKITQEPAPANLINIVKKTGTLAINTLSDEDLKEWVNALQMVAFRDKGGAHGSHAALEEDNDLYCSSFGDGLFIITLIPSDTSIRCNIEPKAYMLHLTATELQLKSAEDINVVISKWPYRFIRKYGYRDGKFTFEAGRKCSTGEGVFTLDHTNPQEVFRCMSAKMKSMKKLISGSDSMSSIECGENQLSIAASMEAGSRSPLPPSPSNQHAGEFEINSTQSCLSLRGFISSSDSLNNFSMNSSNAGATLSAAGGATPSAKHIPNKPPRKLPSPLDKLASAPTTPVTAANSAATAMELKSSSTQLNCDKQKKFQNYEPVSITTSTDPNKTVGSTVILRPSTPEALRKNQSPPDLPVRNESTKTPTIERDYESIETITNAWRTLGVGDVKHTERSAAASTIDDDLIDFLLQRTLSQREKSAQMEALPQLKTQTHKIIDIDIGEGGSSAGVNSMLADATYDRLDFLSPNNKASSGYKTIVTVSSPGNRLRCSSPQPNDYELIASPDIQACRKADDTHLGYGILRKSTTGTPIGTAMEKTNNTTASANNNNNICPQPLNTSNTTNSTTTCPEVSSAVGVTQRTPATPTTATTMATITTSPLDHRNYNGIYTIVSKPKRV